MPRKESSGETRGEGPRGVNQRGAAVRSEEFLPVEAPAASQGGRLLARRQVWQGFQSWEFRGFTFLTLSISSAFSLSATSY